MRRATQILACLVWLIATPVLGQVQGVKLDDPVALPGFVLGDERGEDFADTDLQGHWTLMMFGFLSCPDVCPFTLGNLEAAVAEMGMRMRPDNVPQVVFVSVDPGRDAEAISEYARFFHDDFRSVTGARDQIDLLIEATDSFYRLMPPDASG